MSESKHTPGPWKVVPPAHGHPTEYLCVELDADTMYGTVEMLPADAHLIAAAPDLLKIAETAVKDCPGENCCIAWHAQARAVIAKAKGGE